MGIRHLICVFWKGQWVLAQYGQWNGHAKSCGVKVYRFLSVAQNVEHLKAGLEHHVYYPTEAEIDSMWMEAEDWDDAKHEAFLIVRREHNTLHPLYYDREVFEGIDVLYPSISRDTSYKILSMIARAGPAGGWEQRGYPEGSELIQVIAAARAREKAGSAGASEKTEEAEAEKETSKKIPLEPQLDFARDGYCEWVYVIDLDKEVLEVYGGHDWEVYGGHDWESKIVGHRFEDVRAGRGGSEGLPVLRGSYTFSELYLYKDKEEFLRKLA